MNNINSIFIKKTISIFLILLFGFNSFVLFIFYWGEIQLCKIKAQEFLENDIAPQKSMTVFSSDNEAIKRIDKNEISIFGKLYDIVKTETRKGITVYFTISDTEEDEYVKNLNGWEGIDGRERSLPGKTIELHMAKYFTAEKDQNHFLDYSTHHSPHLRSISDIFLYQSPYKNIFSPPPDI